MNIILTIISTIVIAIFLWGFIIVILSLYFMVTFKKVAEKAMRDTCDYASKMSGEK